MGEEKRKPTGVEVIFPEHLRGGVYCNNMIVTHTKEEFIMDFMMVVPPAGAVTARVVMSPGHMKRTVAALQQNIEGYEKNIGKIVEAPAPNTKGTIGFKKA